VRIYYQGGTSSRWEIPANSEIFKNIFVPYSGAVQDVDLGSYSIAAAGVLLDASAYLNWGTTTGGDGYGLRDNAGTIQFKNSGGTWTDLGGGGAGDLSEAIARSWLGV